VDGVLTLTPDSELSERPADDSAWCEDGDEGERGGAVDAAPEVQVCAGTHCSRLVAGPTPAQLYGATCRPPVAGSGPLTRPPAAAARPLHMED